MMSSSVSTADVPPVAASGEEPAPQDGWRGGGLPALRAELDKIDNAVHDLLMRRASIVEHVARSGKPAAFRPGREASIIRRLVGRHHGALDPATLVRIWRELLAGTTAMQGGFSLAVCDGYQGAPLVQLAREHFGALTRLCVGDSANQALADVSQGAASVAVLPYPSETNDWWIALLHHEPRLHIIGRLPFWQPRPDGAPSAQALVIASTPADASGEDHSFLGFECGSDISFAQLSNKTSAAELTLRSMMLTRQRTSSVAVFAEVDGYMPDDDDRLGRLEIGLRRPIVLGSYAVPIEGATR